MSPDSLPATPRVDNSARDEVLLEGLKQLGIDCSATTRAALLALLDLLQQWNRTYNLTAIRDPAAMVSGHLLDSLSVLPHLPPTTDHSTNSLLDLGCGAGFPGLPVAICDPPRMVTLLDSNQKKTRFVQHACAQLSLENCQVVHQRAEEFIPTERFDTVICRAYSALADFIGQADPLVKPDGTLIAMKGRLPTAELDAIPNPWKMVACTQLVVPGLTQERHLLVFKRDPRATSQ